MSDIYCSATGKVRHEERAIAASICKRRGGGLRPYKCKKCDGWHTGRPVPEHGTISKTLRQRGRA